MKLELERFGEMKVIRRDYEYYVNTGIWADNHLAYSRLIRKNGKRIIDEESEGMFLQIRQNGKLKMIRI